MFSGAGDADVDGRATAALLDAGRLWKDRVRVSAVLVTESPSIVLARSSPLGCRLRLEAEEVVEPKDADAGSLLDFGCFRRDDAPPMVRGCPLEDILDVATLELVNDRCRSVFWLWYLMLFK